MAYNFGARKPKRIRESMYWAFIYSALFYIPFLLILELLPGTVLKLFNASGNMMLIGYPAVRILGLSWFICIPNLVIAAGLQGLSCPTPSMLLTMLRHLRNYHLLDILGDPNGEALWAKAVWAKELSAEYPESAAEYVKPYIGVQPVDHPGEKLVKAAWRGTNAIPSWSFAGCDGNKAVVEVYSDQPTVELFVNGKSIGKKKTKDCRAVFKTVYMSGEIKAAAISGSGAVVSEQVMKSAGSEVSLKITPDLTPRQKENGIREGEYVYLNIAVADAAGIRECCKNAKVKIQVEGGELVGFGSANPRTTERFDAGEYSTYYGRAQAVVRAGREGKLTVRCEDGNGKLAGAMICL